jgi:hypothetical protein
MDLGVHHLGIMIDGIQLVQQLLSTLSRGWPNLATTVQAPRWAGHNLHVIILRGPPFDLAHLISTWT